MVNLEVPHFSTAAPLGATRRTFQPPFTVSEADWHDVPVHLVNRPADEHLFGEEFSLEFDLDLCELVYSDHRHDRLRPFLPGAVVGTALEVDDRCVRHFAIFAVRF